MMSDMRLAIGTEKGGYLLADDGTVEGPLFAGWKVTAWGRRAGRTYAALASNWFGASIHRSDDLEVWTQVDAGPEYGEGRKLEQIWVIREVGDRLLAGVAEAGLFASDDGDAWTPVEAFNEYPGRNDWSPGLGGLATHHILAATGTIWLGVSAVGVFRSDDDGGHFARKDEGVTPVVEDGHCVHGIALDPERPGFLWRQDHSGVYRTDDGGDHWERCETGLPAAFGFPMIRDHASGRLFVVPLESDGNRLPVGGRFAAYRSDDDGDSWEISGTGWADAPQYTTVLRNAATGNCDGTIVLGTTGGSVWRTDDAGEHWWSLPHVFPRILAVALLPG